MKSNRTELALSAAIVGVVLLTLALDPQRTYVQQPLLSLQDILRQSSLLGMFALGSAIVIISGGIDLSSGSMIAFSGTLCAGVMLLLAPEALTSAGAPHVPAWVAGVAIAVTMAAAIGVGSLHAWLVTVIRLPPFVATLASLVGLRSLARGLAPAISEAAGGRGSVNLYVSDERFRALGVNVWIPATVFAVLLIAVWLLLSRTVVGRRLYALGGNEEAARLSGIRTDRLKWLAYCISSCTAALAGVFYIADQSGVNPQVMARAYELNAIAASVVGGCSLAGGVGTAQGVMLGALFLTIVVDGISKVIKQGSDLYQGAIVGLLVVLAVALSGGSLLKRRFLPGPLGGVMIPVLALLTGAFVWVLFGMQPATIAGVGVLVALTGLKAWEARRSTR